MPANLTLQVACLSDLALALSTHTGDGAATFTTGWPPPVEAGAYVWVTHVSAPDETTTVPPIGADAGGVHEAASSDEPDGAVVYIGAAASLATRLKMERAWVNKHNPITEWQVTVLHMLKRFSAVPHWFACESHPDAELLERRLIEWHRALTGIAPVLVGWNAKQGSETDTARRWSQELWERRATDPPTPNR